MSATGDFGVTTGTQTVTIPTTGSYTLTVATTNDGVEEDDGSVTVTVNSGQGYTVSETNGAATVVVSDDGSQQVCVMPSDAVTVDEVTGWRDAHAHDEAHVLRWNRVLAALGVDNGLTPMTAAESEANESQFTSSRWERVTSTLTALEQCAADG